MSELPHIVNVYALKLGRFVNSYALVVTIVVVLAEIVDYLW